MKNYHTKKNQVKTRNAFKNVILASMFLGMAYVSGQVILGRWLIEGSFQIATWYECNGPIDSCYFNEDIVHNKYNYFTYKFEVEKKSKLERKSMRPDLDKDSSVCSCVSNK